MTARGSLWKSLAWISTLAAGLVFQSCETGGDSGSPVGPVGGIDSLAPIVLFQGEYPALQSGTPVLESGMAKTATGKLNPLVFVDGKNPLQKAGSRLTLNLFEKTTFTAVVESSQTLGPRRYVAFGHIEGISGSSFIATCENTTLTALVTVPGAGVFRVESSGSGTYRAVLQNDFAPACPPTPAPTVILDTSFRPAPLRKASAAEPVIVDIMVVYTAAAVIGAKSSAAMNSLVDAAVAQANEAYRNSKIDVILNLVYRGQISYTESGGIQTDLTRLQSSNDGYLADVHTLRNTYGADIVTLITETGEAQWAGLGYVMAAVNPAYKDYAFNVVRRAYASGYSVLAHEIGHNMGCMHDPANSSNAGAFAYSYGHRWNGTDNVQYRDLMAYAPGKSINYFSNPAILYKGVATGVTGSANTAQTITNTLATVAAYRPRAMPSVTLTSPTQGSSLMAPANVILNAVTGGSPMVAKVEFYNGTTLLGTDAAAPYSFAWNPVALGTYTVSAKVYTKSGLTATSAPVTFQSANNRFEGTFTEVFVGTTGTATTSTASGNENDVITMTGIGPGIAGKADAFQFAYTPKLMSDAEVSANLKSMSATASGALAGLMIRESLEPGARCLFIGRNGLGELVLLKRTTLNGSIVASKPASSKPPTALLLIRKGTDIAVYRNDDGRSWILITGLLMAFPNGAYGGMATTSGSLATSNTAVFEKVRWLSYEPPVRGDYPPSVVISSPLNGTSYLPGKSVTFTTTVSDRDGVKDVKRVEFHNTTVFAPGSGEDGSLGIDTAAPYTHTWTTVSGTAHIKARVQDAFGYESYSTDLILNVLAPGQRLVNPVADATVANGRFSNANYGTAATLTARTNPTDGSTSESHLYFRIDSLATIAHATLRMYGNVLGGTGDVQVEAHAVDSTGWLESGTVGLRKGITWTLKPPVGALIAAKTVSGATGKWYEFDVTAHVKARKAAGMTMAGFALQGVDSTAAYASFASRTAAAGKPELILSDH
jgi:hypothetical protein